MKKLFVFLVLSLPILLFGQTLSKDIKVTNSTPFQVVDAKSKVYEAIGGGISFSVKTQKEIVTIQKFDANTMKEVGRSVSEDFPKGSLFIKLVNVKNRLYYISEVYDRKTKSYSVYSREINTKTAKFNTNKKLFTTTKPVSQPREILHNTIPQLKIGVIKGAPKPKFQVFQSYDGSKVMFRYRNKPAIKDDSKNYDVLGFYVFDDTMNKIWGKEAKMPHTEKEMNNIAYTVTSNGTAFMLSRLNETKSLELITITKDGLKNKKLDVKSGIKFDEFRLNETPNGNIIAAGYYANGTEVKVTWAGGISTSTNVNGLYVFETTQEGKLVRKNEYPFSLELIKKHLTDRQKNKSNAKEEKGTAGINDLRLKNLTVNNDGSIVVIGEVIYTRQQGVSQNYYSNYRNIVITKIGADGKEIWSDKLAKNQSVPIDPAAQVEVPTFGISYAKGDDAHYILFVDSRKNATMEPGETPLPYKGRYDGYLTAYKIDDETGKVEKHLIIDLTNIQGKKAYQFSIKRIFEVSDKSFLLEIYIKGKKDMMVKMDILK